VALAGNPTSQLSFTAISWIICIIALLAFHIKTSGRPLEEITEKTA
jgi:hypothetical protein